MDEKKSVVYLSALRFDVIKADRNYAERVLIFTAYYKENGNYNTIHSSFWERFPNVPQPDPI